MPPTVPINEASYAMGDPIGSLDSLCSFSFNFNPNVDTSNFVERFRSAKESQQFFLELQVSKEMLLSRLVSRGAVIVAERMTDVPVVFLMANDFLIQIYFRSILEVIVKGSEASQFFMVLEDCNKIWAYLEV